MTTPHWYRFTFVGISLAAMLAALAAVCPGQDGQEPLRPKRLRFQVLPPPPPTERGKISPPTKPDSPAPERATTSESADDQGVGSTNRGTSESHRGMEQFREAHALSASANDKTAFTKIIETCRAGMQAGVSASDAKYGRKLMAWAFNKRGELHVDEGDNKRAMEDFQSAVRLDDRQWRAVHNRGVSYALQGKYREALADFDRAVDLNPKYANAWFNRGEAQYELGEYQAAVRDYTTVLRIAPNDAAAHNSRGHAYYRLNRFTDAVRDYDRAVAIDPKSVAALINRADAYADLGSYAEAARDYRAAIDLDPNAGRAYLSAAWLMATCPNDEFRDADLALQAAKKAIELDGDRDYHYLETLAAAQASAGEFKAAAQTQAEAAALAPEDAVEQQRSRIALYERSVVYREPARGKSPVSPAPRRDRTSRRPGL